MKTAIRVFNKTTKKTFELTDRKEKLNYYKNVKDLFNKLGQQCNTPTN